MYLIVIAWLYVVFMAAVVEATSSVGTVLGAVITFVLYGLVPLSIVVYIFGTPARKRALHAQAMAERAARAPAPPDAAPTPAAPAPAALATSAAPDANGKTPAGPQSGAVAAVREEP